MTWWGTPGVCTPYPRGGVARGVWGTNSPPTPLSHVRLKTRLPNGILEPIEHPPGVAGVLIAAALRDAQQP